MNGCNLKQVDESLATKGGGEAEVDDRATEILEF
jgi:hypothetical protein